MACEQARDDFQAANADFIGACVAEDVAAQAAVDAAQAVVDAELAKTNADAAYEASTLAADTAQDQAQSAYLDLLECEREAQSGGGETTPELFANRRRHGGK